VDGTVTLTLPDLDLHRSRLLQAAINERFFRVWDYERDGPFPHCRAVKDEAERLAAEIQAENPAEELFAATEGDLSFMRGSSFRGPERYAREQGTRPAAFRQLELLLHRQVGDLNLASVQPPSREDRVCRVVPGLFDALSRRDGLLPLRPEMVPRKINHDRYLYFGEHALFPHPGISGARELVGDLWALAAAGADIRVAIDPNRVVHREDTQDAVLLDYWFGIKPTRADLDDLSVVGHTRHERRADMHGRFGSGELVGTDFWWSAEGNRKVLKVEETVPRSAYRDRTSAVWNRFLHSIRDTAERRFVHLDGAIKAYPVEHYGADFDSPTARKGEDPVYRKMWRVEGPIEESEWGRLVGHFFRGNELVIEYFGEALDERSTPVTA